MPLQKLFSWFDADERKQRAFDKAVARIVSKNHQHEERMLAMEGLASEGTPEADAALFRRWDMISDKKREDVAEKEYLAELLVKKGESVLPHLRAHNDRSVNITWPIQVLKRISDDSEVAEELLRLLAREQERVAAFKPEKKIRILQMLGDYEDDRIPGAVAQSLGDFDETVRYEAARLLGAQDSAEAGEALLDRCCSPEEDSLRVRSALLDALFQGGWKVLQRKDDLAPHLGTAYRIGPKGTLVVVD